MNKKLKVQEGFTIIELLAVMVILMSIGTIIGAILFTSLRGASKTSTINSVRQNGYFALTQMTKMIRQASRFGGVSTDGTNYVANCTAQSVLPPTPTPTPRQYNYIKITSHDLGQTTFSCLAGDTISSQSGSLSPVSLLDKTAVSLVSCSITCTQNTTGEPPTIEIQFTLSQYAPTGTTFIPERSSTVPFKTSVTLRNR